MSENEIPSSWASIRSPANFAALGLPVPSSMPTPNEAQREARKRSTELLSSWRKLQQILERYEDVLRKRWTKKTKTQRTNIVLRAWPNMSPTHRPDYEAFRKEGTELKFRATRFRESYVWPYINIEDLVKGKTLLLFLNSRGRHPPSVFAHADIEAMHLGHVSTAVMPAFLNLHTMLLEGEEVETYGRLVSWDDDEDARDRTLAGLAHQPGEGLLILEIQQRILRFLVECCHAILHDIDADSLISEVVKPEPPALADSSDWPTLASISAEAPYRVPARLDFLRLKALVTAKRSSVEDHLHSLREDPGYFADFLRDWSEHRQEQMLDTNNARHPLLDTPLFWERVIGSVIMDAYDCLMLWDIISEQLTHLAALQSKYSDVITPEETLPEDYMKALLTLRFTLNEAEKVPILRLKMGIPASPQFRPLWVREPQTPGSNIIQVRSKPGTGADPMMWLFNCLWNEHQLFLHRLPRLVDEIEYLVQNNPKEKSRLSPWVARVFADLGLMAKLQHELEIYQPWAAGFEYEFVGLRREIEKDMSQHFDLIREVERNLDDHAFAKFGDPTGGRFKYPSDKRRTKETTESMRKAEANLDLFWDKVDEHYRRNSGKTISQTLQHILKKVRQLERTPEWVEPMPEKRKITAPFELDLEQRFPGLRVDSADSSSKFVAPVPKTKPKTRGSAQSETNTTEEQSPSPAEDTQCTFTLKSRAFKVFKALFYNPSQSDLPGEISWADFLYAMAATGFAPEKLYGSIWQFTPSKLGVERSIQFHEPHPVGKIPFRTARRIGRRLSRAYGWHGAMFVLE